MIRSVAGLLLVATALSGCVAVWGRSYTVEQQTADAVSIKYDRNFGSLKEVVKVAQADCGNYGRKAVLVKKTTSVWQLTTVDFKCVDG